MNELWYVALGQPVMLACKAETADEAKRTFADCGYLIQNMPDGSYNFVAYPAPPELAEWLNHDAGAVVGRMVKAAGGWICVADDGHQATAVYNPVWGASGIRVVERHLVQPAGRPLPKDFMPSVQGFTPPPKGN